MDIVFLNIMMIINLINLICRIKGNQRTKVNVISKCGIPHIYYTRLALHVKAKIYSSTLLINNIVTFVIDHLIFGAVSIVSPDSDCKVVVSLLFCR